MKEAKNTKVKFTRATRAKQDSQDSQDSRDGRNTNVPTKKTSRLQRLRGSVTDWPKLLTGSAMVAFVGGLLVYKLGDLVSVSPTEVQTIRQAQSLSSLGENILLAPYKLFIYFLSLLPGSDLFHVRLASAIITCMSVWLFFVLAKRWYGTYASLWASLALASSTWILQTGRFAAAYSVLALTVLALLNLAVWVSHTEDHGRAIVVFALVSGLALFTPGGVLFVVAVAILLRKPLLEHRAKASPRQIATAAAIFMALLVGLASGLIQNVQIVDQWLGWPDQLPTLGLALHQALASAGFFVLRGPGLPEIWLAGTPLLDVGSTVLLVLGIIFYSRHLKNTRTRLLLAFSLISVCLITVNGAVALSYAIPTVYLIIGGGLAYVMHQWNRTFPHNPIARSISLVLISGLLLAVIGFHTLRYFVAWRYNPERVDVYSQDSAQPPARTLLE